ncbi:predicted protein [Arabidopsis lyrata subsp. lyrata]|uniref:Predicted protein n=1 Tax=Arabidopsis lyrata subsp. lyrata TaxID=81972 RepID=D7MP68_ARALL|nr:predicted protein [Arabidopsis lyrata subsp. lyrata]
MAPSECREEGADVMRRFDRTYMPLLLMKLELKIRSLCGLNKPKCIECGNVAPASGDSNADFHVEDSKITLNVCLSKQGEGGEIFFAGTQCKKHMDTDPKPENARRDAEQQASQTRIANLERLVMYWKESDPAFAAFVASQPQPTAPANTQAANATATNATATANAPASAPTGTVAATTTPSSSF